MFLAHRLIFTLYLPCTVKVASKPDVKPCLAAGIASETETQLDRHSVSTRSHRLLQNALGSSGLHSYLIMSKSDSGLRAAKLSDTHSVYSVPFTSSSLSTSIGWSRCSESSSNVYHNGALMMAVLSNVNMIACAPGQSLSLLRRNLFYIPPPSFESNIAKWPLQTHIMAPVVPSSTDPS